MTSDTQQSWAEFTSFSARLAHLLRRAARIWAKPTEATGSDAAAAAKEWREETAEADGQARSRLPWWAVHHPAVSFRGRAPEDRLD